MWNIKYSESRNHGNLFNNVWLSKFAFAQDYFYEEYHCAKCELSLLDMDNTTTRVKYYCCPKKRTSDNINVNLTTAMCRDIPHFIMQLLCLFLFDSVAPTPKICESCNQPIVICPTCHQKVVTSQPQGGEVVCINTKNSSKSMN